MGSGSERSGYRDRDLSTPLRPSFRTALCGTDTGLWHSADDGYNWEPLLDRDRVNAVVEPDVAAAELWDLAIHPNEQVIYVATPYVGVLQSTNGGADWTVVSHGIDSKAVVVLALDPSDPATVYASTRAAGTWKRRF